jgi:hypothetical protein
LPPPCGIELPEAFMIALPVGSTSLAVGWLVHLAI